MSGGIIGGDEVGALVVDIGSYTTRVGYAGEDMPKADFPSYTGYIEEQAESTESMDLDQQATSAEKNIKTTTNKKEFIVDTMAMRAPRAHMEVHSYLKNGLIEDWAALERVLEYTFSRHLKCDPTTHPILMTEPVTNTKLKREKMCELVFEKFGAPGFYMAKNGVLSAFASNRTSGLVLDCGASHTTTIPIHDGYVLNKAVAQSPLGGEFILSKCRQLLEEQLDIEVVPYYMIKSKEAVKPNEPARFVRRLGSTDCNQLTESYKKFMGRQTLLDFATQVLQVSDTSYQESEISVLPRMPYEFPNGFNSDFGEERYRIPEALFNPSILKGIAPNSMLDVVHLITSSINMCDAELRSSFFSNITVVGGNSLLNGFVDRLNFAFNQLNYKTKISSPPTTAERRFSSWIGGSILGSLGTFHQMWISKQEYEETGRFIVDKKCL